MPLLRRNSTKRKRIETTTTPTAKKDVPRDLVLDKEKIFVKLNENIIVGDKAINGKQIFADVRNMKNILQGERLHRTS